MSYRHRIVAPSPEMRNLAVAASQVSAQRLRLPYRPAVNFFIEDEHGRFERPWRASGFVDYYRNAEGLDIFSRSGQSEAKTVRTIWHEARHIADHVNKVRDSLPLSELRAERFALSAPWGNHNDVMRVLNDEIELWVSARGDPQTIAETRKRRAHNRAENEEFIEMIKRRLRYSDDDKDDEEGEIAEDVALPVKPVMGLDTLTLVKAERFLKDAAQEERRRTQHRKEQEEAEARLVRARALRDAEVDAEFNRWNGLTPRSLGNGR